MTANAKRDLIEQFLAGKLSRREFAAAACGLGFSAMLVDRVLAGQQPPPQFTEQPTVAYPLTTEKVTFRVLAGSNPGVEDFATNEFTRWYEDKTNVHLEWEVVADDEYIDAINLRLSSGEYPDLFLTTYNYPSRAMLMLHGSQGRFVALDDLIEQHGIYYKEMVTAYPFTEEAVTAVDDNVYAFPYVNDCYHCSLSQKLWIYQPWLEKLGLAMPQTTEEFYQVLKAFKEQDPNGNGQADEIPLTSSTDNWNGDLDAFFMNSFIFSPGGNRLMLRDGKVTAIYATPEWRDAVTYLARLYAEGLIGAQTFTQDTDQLKRLVDNPDAPLVGCAPCGWKGGISATDLADPDSRIRGYVTVPPLVGPEGVRIAALNPYDTYRFGSFMVTDKCPDPALAIRWADGLYEFETTIRSNHGAKDRDWRWAEAGEVGINGQPAIWRRLDVGATNNRWDQTGPSFRSDEFRLGEAVDPEQAESHLEVILYNETKEKYEPYQQPAEMALPPLWFTEEQARGLDDLAGEINAFVEQTMAAAVTGSLDLEARWDEYRTALDTLGLPIILGTHQQVYDAQYQQ